MTWVITILVGFTIGILFSFTYPEPAMAVNEVIKPTIDSVLVWIGETTMDFVRSAVESLI